MKKDAIISLPWYKVMYAIAFIGLLPMVRGISTVEEIGLALDSMMAILACVFCADTCYQEIQEGRWEILSLKPVKNQKIAVRKRLFVQYLFLMVLVAVSYGLFMLFQKPYTTGDELSLFLQTMFAAFVSLFFFAELTIILVDLIGNLWAGIGAMVLLWFFLVSKAGQSIPITLQVFSYMNRNLGNPGDLSWIIGKCVALAIALLCFICYGRLGSNKKQFSTQPS